MNRDLIEGGWKQFSGKLQERWSKLRGDAEGVSAARHTQLAGSIQVRHGHSKEEIARQLKEFLHRNRDWDISGRGPGVGD